MHQLLNTLYVMTQGSYLRLDHETIKVEAEGELKLQAPLHHIGGVVCFGNVLISPFLIRRLTEEGRRIVILGQTGRFTARIEGPVSGNVLLRKAQFETLNSPSRVVDIARNMVAGKIRNTRQVASRSFREASEAEDKEVLGHTLEALAASLERLESVEDIDSVRGVEGEAQRNYFETFNSMIREDREVFGFSGRTRRPPRDRVNCLLSFLYTLLRFDCSSALEGVGLDPQVGFLHALRPGRPALALDLMEEFRPVLADRLALTLVNRRQIRDSHFEHRPGGAVLLSHEGRKEVVVAYQKRKQDEVQHPLLKKKTPFGLVCHIQARLLARHLRGDMDSYIPFIYR